jgi:steroid delta-isomerase-like uncharacterized protein
MERINMTTTEQAHVETVRRLYEQYLNQNRPELLDSLVSEDVVLHTTTEERGIAAYAALTDRLRVAFPDMRFTLQDVISSDDRVAVRWTMKATHSGPLAGIPATGKRVEQRANVIYRFVDGKIAEGWALVDQAGMLRQLGFDPLVAARAAAAK